LGEKTIPLKDPMLAAFLAWLVPGLGHFYQGRTAKAILFFVCIMGTFTYGCYLGGNSRLGWGRVVYISWSDEDWRLYFIGQAGMGLPVLPAVIQAQRVSNKNPPLWHSFMAPPLPDWSALDPNNPNDVPAERAKTGRFTLDEICYELHEFFELGTVYTVIAGLLNMLVIFDAWAGPVFAEESPAAKKEDDEQETAKKDAAT
jgi:hypothetical protein